MDIRKNAVDLNPSEKEASLEAIIKLKKRQAPGTQPGISVYDQFVALHGAVMAVVSPSTPDPINFAHGNIGFLPWHRQYIRTFELALQQEVPGVTLPYWDWSDDVGTATELFTPNFLSSTTWGIPTPISNGILRFRVPPRERPDWWPSGIQGFVINQYLREGLGNALTRGSTEPAWPPSATEIDQLTKLNISIRGANPLWAFWIVLEQGFTSITLRTHNAAPRFIGGHMSGGFSPNDPIFWMHHANVDRIWAIWQKRQLAQNPGSTYEDYWPDPTENSPFIGQPAPTGHNLHDDIWPWTGNAPGYQTVSVSQAVQSRLRDFSTDPTVKVADVLDFEAMGFEYA